MNLKKKPKLIMGKKNFNAKFNLIEKDVNKYNKEFIYLIPWFTGTVIQCEYEILVPLYYENYIDYKNRPKVICPIIISVISKNSPQASQKKYKVSTLENISHGSLKK